MVVAVGVNGGVSQCQDISTAGRQGWLGGCQVGTRTTQCSGFTGKRGQNNRVAVQQRGGGSLQDKLGALDALILITLKID